MSKQTPKERGFFFPAEWYPHEATWLSWPHNKNSWPGKIETIYKPYSEFVKYLSKSEKVRMNVNDAKMEEFARGQLEKAGADLSNITFYHHPTNDAWCRDHGPAFVINESTKEKEIINWGHNAWGGKYPWELDNEIPVKVADALGLKYQSPGIVMEGGSVDFNGAGVLLTTTACLLNSNRNPHLTMGKIETYLRDFYGVEEIWWLEDGIEGDDTDGHIDDITRFVSEDTVMTAIEPVTTDFNHYPLKENLKKLKKQRLPNGRQLNIIELPMPKAVIYDGQRLPASYANFYISNKYVIVPTYRDDTNDRIALDLIAQSFEGREIIGIDSTDVVWGLGSFHCLSQQEPRV